MFRYVLKRLLMMIPIVLGVSFLIYFIMDLAPGNIIDNLLTEDMSVEAEQELIHAMGYDRSVFYRYLIYIKNLVFHGDLGTSYTTMRPVWESFAARFPYTLWLAGASMIVATVISIPLGIISAVKNGTVVDNASMVLALLGLSIPNFWLGILLILGFSLNLGWLPSMGATSFASCILPAITVGTGYTATITRTTRSSMVDVLRQDYLRTARSKGTPEHTVILKHAFRNSLIPILTIMGTTLAHCLSGAVLTETVFAWPGIGRLVVDAVNQRDVPMVTGVIIMTTIIMSIVLLIVDLLYAVVDPRIRAQYVGKKGGRKK